MIPAMLSSSSRRLGGLAATATRAISVSSAAAFAPSSTPASSSSSGFLSAETLNADLLAAQYAVRGEIVLRALEIQKSGKKKLTFCNIGNPQELGQLPISFFRQVFALVNCPSLLEHPQVGSMFPADVIARAKRYLAMIPCGSTGAYTNSQGIEGIREEVAAFITARDGGYKAHASDIFLTDGASPAVQMMIRAMVRDKRDCLMIPIPQYPLYSASLALYGGSQAGYLLNEQKGWSLEPEELERSYAAAKKDGKTVRGIAVINPGNPTGNCLSEENIEAVLRFASKKKLVVLADEVYQNNCWLADTKPFKSFKQVACKLGLVDPNATHENKGIQLASFHSTSKGFIGECGRRGGYVELCGFDPAIRSQLYKLASISLCSNTGGQLMTGLMCNPPKEGEHSYAQYCKERDDILSSLKRRATKLVAALNKMEGVSCQAPEGALYVFPTITLPKKVMEAAAKAGKAPDAFYSLSLLEETGIVVVPGSGFGQKEGTFHFRSTILPPEADIDRVIDAMAAFHKGFLAKWA